MALRHALLATLLDGPATGYELSKWFDAGVANFWHATKPQLYAELTKLEDAGLVTGTPVVQHDRPNKRVMAITEAGTAELDAFVRAPSRPLAVKSDLLVKVRALDVVDPVGLRAELREAAEVASARLARFVAIEAQMRKGRDHPTYLAEARRVGPYLTLRLGIDRERATLAWLDEVLQVLDHRHPEPAPADAAVAPRPHHTKVTT